MIILSIVIFLLTHVSSDPISDFKKPATPPKYFAIDIEGTFYITDETKFKKNVEAFKRLKDKNIIPFFCTGRHLECTKKRFEDSFFNETGYNGFPGVYLNGALVYDANGMPLSEKFKSEFINKFVDYAEENNLKDQVMYYTSDGTFSLEELCKKEMDIRKSRSRTVPVVVTVNDLKSKDIIMIEIFKLGMSSCSFMSDVSSVEYTNHNLTQITPSVCSKKEGLVKLVRHLGSNENECAFIGDDLNDVEAMEYFTMSFAVADAKNEAKNKAKWLLDLNHDDCAFEKVVNLLLD